MAFVDGQVLTAAQLNDLATSADLSTAVEAKVNEINGYNLTASQSAETALSSSQTAQIAMTTAQAAADSAESIADNSATYADTTTGLAGTTSGQYFRVAQGADSYNSFIYYLNNSGVAEAVATTVGSAAVTSALPQYSQQSGLVAVLVDDAGNVPLYLNNGQLGAAQGLDAETMDYIFSNSDTFNEVQAYATPVTNPSGALTAVCQDLNGNVPIWLDGGKPDAVGLGPILMEYLQNNLEFATPVVATTPLVSDGGTLYRWRDKRSRLDVTMMGTASLSAHAKIGFTGDSWTEWIVNPQALRDILLAKGYPKAGDGYIQFGVDTGGPDAGIGHQMTGITVTKSGWTIYDASVSASVTPPYGCAADGMSIYTSTTTATLSYTITSTSSITVNYWDTTGAFRYNIDGGAYTTITCGNTLVAKSFTVTLTSGAHTINIDTSVNTGVVSLINLYSEDTGVGVTVNKLGNGGITAIEYGQVLPYIPYTATALDLDVLVMIIGTNDAQIPGITQASFEAALDAWVNAWQTASPTTGIILVIPAPANIIDYNIPLADIRDSMVRISKKYGVEYLDYRGFVGANYAYDNVNGIYYDGLHMNAAGGHNLANLIYKNFLE